jgi:hypothetical protein
VIGGADISMSGVRVRAHHIRGILVNGVTGQPVSGARIQALSVKANPSQLLPTGITSGTGAFDLPGATAGKYIVYTPYLSSGTAGPAAPDTVGYVAVEMSDADINDLRVVAQPAFVINGRITVQGRSPVDSNSDLQKIRLLLNREQNIDPYGNVGMPNPSGNSGGGPTTVKGNGSFAMMKVAPGDFRLTLAGLPPNTYIKSATLGLNDLLADGLHILSGTTDSLEIILGTDVGEVTGVAVGAKKEVVTNSVVVLVPDSLPLRGRVDLYQNTTADTSGRFNFKAVPPGDYKLFAWDYVEPGAWMYPPFLQPYESSGKVIHVTEGKKLETEATVLARR